MEESGMAQSVRFDRQSDGRYVLTARQRLPQPPATLFPFFADSRNLERITPPWLSFRVVTPEPIEMGEGVEIDYRLKVHGVPMRWRSRILTWEPPHRFIDEQVKGPYRQWHHEHLLEPNDNGGTTLTDRVTYAVPGGALVHGLIVRRDVRAIFTYRIRAIEQMFVS